MSLARTADGWWAVTPAGLVRLDLPAATTAGLLADRAVLHAAIEAAQATAATAPRDAVPADSAGPAQPGDRPGPGGRAGGELPVARDRLRVRPGHGSAGVLPQGLALHHRAGRGHHPPDGVGFLDYEVELGLVIGADLPVGTTVTEADLARYVAALVVANDVSARQIQLVKTQFYESKSYPTFTPVGPWLTLVDAADLARLGSLRLTLS